MKLENVKKISFYGYRHLYVYDIIMIIKEEEGEEIKKELKKRTEKFDNWGTYKIELNSNKKYYLQIADDEIIVGLSVKKGDFYYKKVDNSAFI